MGSRIGFAATPSFIRRKALDMNVIRKTFSNPETIGRFESVVKKVRNKAF